MSRIKADYESDLDTHKNNLDELNSNYKNALSANIRWEKEATSFKKDLKDATDENDKRARCANALEDELSNVRSRLERAALQLQRSQAKRSRFEKEFGAASKDRDEAVSDYDDLLKKLDAM